MIDTGFTGTITLPRNTIDTLGLRWLSKGKTELANGAIDTFDIFRVFVNWDGQMVRTVVESAETDPLVGMTLMYGYDIFVQNVVGGRVVLKLPR